MTSVRATILIVLFSFLVLGCREGNAVSDENRPRLRLDEVFEYDGSSTTRVDRVVGNTSEILIGDLTDVLIRDGHVYIADGMSGHVLVLTLQGDRVRTIGKRGEGPGEFAEPVSVFISDDDTLYVLDAARHRVSRFGPAPAREFVASTQITVSEGRLPESLVVAPDGRLFLWSVRPHGSPFGEAGRWLIELCDDGTICRDNLLQLRMQESIVRRDGRRVVSFERPFARTTFIDSDRDGNICYGWSESLDVTCQALDGDTVRVIKAEHEPRRVSDADITSRSRMYNDDEWRIIEGEELHRTYPAIMGFMIDVDNRLWMREPVEEDSISAWLVLNLDTHEYRVVELPSDKFVVAAKDTIVYMSQRPITSELTILHTSK